MASLSPSFRRLVTGAWQQRCHSRTTTVGGIIQAFHTLSLATNNHHPQYHQPNLIDKSQISTSLVQQSWFSSNSGGDGDTFFLPRAQRSGSSSGQRGGGHGGGRGGQVGGRGGQGGQRGGQGGGQGGQRGGQGGQRGGQGGGGQRQGLLGPKKKYRGYEMPKGDNNFIPPDKSVKKPMRANVVMLMPGDYDDLPELANRFKEDEADDDFSEDFSDNEKMAIMVKASKKMRRLERERGDELRRVMFNNLRKVRVPLIDDSGKSYGRGGRKRAQARVWIQPGFGNVVINRRPFVEYFERPSDRDKILQPFVATETCGDFDMHAAVRGGGKTGQAGAIRHGLAHALTNFNPDQYYRVLKFCGYMKRDPRKVERKKIGLKKARKAPQWVRR